MSAVYDNWERLVDATLLREKLRFLARIDSLSSASDSGSSFRSESAESFRVLTFPDLGYSFAYDQLVCATDGFSSVNLMKRGHSGDFFRGYLPELSSILPQGNQILRPGSINIAIKRIDLRLVGNRDAYSSELNLLSKIPEVSRFSPFLGFCREDEQIFMVYKYAAKGDLSSFLHQQIRENGDLQTLDWITRLKIAIGAAERLVYLHDECTPPIVHGDVQASSILVDDKFDVWLGSLSQVRAEERIGKGNLDNTRAYDVYCFGKVMLELVTGRLGISSGAVAKEWLYGILPRISIYDMELVIDILDPSLIVDEDLLEEVWGMAVTARACLNPRPSQRPLMRYVLKALENPLKVVRDKYGGRAAHIMPSKHDADPFGSWWQISGNVEAAPSFYRSKGSAQNVADGTHISPGRTPRRSFPYFWRRK